MQSHYSTKQIKNLPKKRRALDRLIKRLKAERSGKNRPEVIMDLSQEFQRRFKYLTKGTNDDSQIVDTAAVKTDT